MTNCRHTISSLNSAVQALFVTCDEVGGLPLIILDDLALFVMLVCDVPFRVIDDAKNGMTAKITQVITTLCRSCEKLLHIDI